MANPIVAYSEIEIADVFGLVSKNPNKSLKFVELRSATFFTEEIKTTGTVSFNDDGLMSKYIIKILEISDKTSESLGINLIFQSVSLLEYSMK
jgi:hypothetical protein